MNNSPYSDKEMILKNEPYTMKYKGKEVDIIYYYYLCEESGLRFTNDEIDERNIQAVKKRYKELYGNKQPENI